MAYTAVAKPSAHFDVPYWAGSSSTTTVTGMGFKPDILWIRRYDGNGHPVFNDSTKGIGFNWIPSGNNANDTTNYVASYTSDGFTLTGGQNNSNAASQYYSAACFKANGGTTSSNSDGSVTSTVQANTTAGISVVAWTGTGANATIGHGLGVAPKLILVKSTGLADRGIYGNGGTIVYSDPWTDGGQFAWEGAQAFDDATFWNDTAPTTSVFSVGSHAKTNPSSGVMIAYVFAEIQGFSKFGHYIGNGNVKGPTIYCGFRPKYVLVKRWDGTSEDWAFKVSGINAAAKHGSYSSTYGLGGELKRTLKYNTNAPSTNCTINITATGFRLTTTDGKANLNTGKYTYMAFAEMPIVGTNGTVGLAI
tara:strand:- start:89 stop:1177 length:1089 start_codon:yes stop_codon:yes gene_type:complete